jgi:copper chaperone CopZ
MTVITLHVPGMTSRSRLRTVTARLRDLPGADTVEANADTAMVAVHGDISEADVRAALSDVGFPATDPAR